MTEELKTYLKENVEDFFSDNNIGRMFNATILIENLKTKGITDPEEVREAARYVIAVGMNNAY